MKEKIRPIYSELQGYLSQTPSIKENHDVISQKGFWEQVNSTIDELNTISEKDFSKYKLIPEPGDERYMRVPMVRLKLGGLISRLHGEYYSDEQTPFSGMPSSITNITQNQQQTATQTIILEFQDIINEKIASTPDEKEKTFLLKIKKGLGTIKNTGELIKLVLETAKEFGLDISDVATIFS